MITITLLNVKVTESAIHRVNKHNPRRNTTHKQSMFGIPMSMRKKILVYLLLYIVVNYMEVYRDSISWQFIVDY